MESTIHKKSQVLRELEIFVGEDELQSAFDQAFREIRPRLRLPGFRPGKAPIDVIKRLHGDSIEGETLEKLAQQKFHEAVTEHSIEPIGRPVMTDLHRHTGEGAHFRIAYEVKPDITLVDYDGIEIEKPSAEITDEDVNERLHYLQFVNAVREPADVISDNEYVAHVTFREVDSIEEPQKSEIYLGDKRIVDELRSLLIGKKPGEIFTADLPRSEGDGSMKNVKVEVTVNNIDKVILPEITEEFCKTISREKAVTELEVRKLIREELEETSRRNADQIMESNMVNALLSRHNFEVPQTLTYALIDANIEEARRRNQQQGLPADHGIDIEQIRKVYWAESEQRAKWLLLREKLIEAEQIEVSDADIEELASKDAAMYGISPENLLTYYKQNEDIRERIRSQKLVDALKQKFIITETTKQA